MGREAAYRGVREALARRWPAPPPREEMMRGVADALWERFGGAPYSWVGFYLLAEDRGSLVLGPHRDSPACSPIGTHGVCGRCALEGRALLVDDVGALGPAHIVCDPRNRSEVCLPVRGGTGEVWGVLDADSREPAAFGPEDLAGLSGILEDFAR